MDVISLMDYFGDPDGPAVVIVHHALARRVRFLRSELDRPDVGAVPMLRDALTREIAALRPLLLRGLPPS